MPHSCGGCSDGACDSVVVTLNFSGSTFAPLNGSWTVPYDATCSGQSPGGCCWRLDDFATVCGAAITLFVEVLSGSLTINLGEGGGDVAYTWSGVTACETVNLTGTTGGNLFGGNGLCGGQYPSGTLAVTASCSGNPCDECSAPCGPCLDGAPQSLTVTLSGFSVIAGVYDYTPLNGTWTVPLTTTSTVCVYQIALGSFTSVCGHPLGMTVRLENAPDTINLTIGNQFSGVMEGFADIDQSCQTLSLAPFAVSGDLCASGATETGSATVSGSCGPCDECGPCPEEHFYFSVAHCCQCCKLCGPCGADEYLLTVSGSAWSSGCCSGGNLCAVPNGGFVLESNFGDTCTWGYESCSWGDCHDSHTVGDYVKWTLNLAFTPGSGWQWTLKLEAQDSALCGSPNLFADDTLIGTWTSDFVNDVNCDTITLITSHATATTNDACAHTSGSYACTAPTITLTAN